MATGRHLRPWRIDGYARGRASASYVLARVHKAWMPGTRPGMTGAKRLDNSCAIGIYRITPLDEGRFMGALEVERIGVRLGPEMRPLGC